MMIPEEQQEQLIQQIAQMIQEYADNQEDFGLKKIVKAVIGLCGTASQPSSAKADSLSLPHWRGETIGTWADVLREGELHDTP